jgi:GNAT superfamily N-acetyltransferase
MTRNRLRLEPLRTGSTGHDRTNFSCGDEILDRYLATQAGQDMRRGFANVIVAVHPGSEMILGYYSLSAASASLEDLPETLTSRLPRYGQVPAVLLGRLAVDLSAQKRGIGSLLLADAVKRAHGSELAWALFLVKAKNERVSDFYRHFGFAAFAREPLWLWNTRKEIARLLEP